MNFNLSAKKLVLFLILLGIPKLVGADDWPMWRHDSGRTATTTEALDRDKLKLKWVRELPPLEPAFHEPRLQFDAGYEPIVQGKQLFLASSRSKSVSAFDTETGERQWQFFTQGPVRFAPVAWKKKVYVGSDDGFLYSLDAETGKLIWKFRAVPSNRKVLGNRQLISTWPVRGGPVIEDGKIYFAAGVWPFEGVFIYCLDARSGAKIWINDNVSYIFSKHPHDTYALGGLSPQGYFLFNRGELIVPCGAAFPARFNPETGEMTHSAIQAEARNPGGWFVSTLAKKEEQLPASRGLFFDRKINRSRHEDRWYISDKQGYVDDIRKKIRSHKGEWSLAALPPGVKGRAYSMLIADRKLFVTTLEGGLYCYEEDFSGTVIAYKPPVRSVKQSESVLISALRNSVKGKLHGYAVVFGLDDSNRRLLRGLVQTTDLVVAAVDEDFAEVDRERRALSDQGLYGYDLNLFWDRPEKFEMPPYFASLIVVGRTLSLSPELLSRLYRSVRPFGGVLVLSGVDDAAALVKQANLYGAVLEKNGSYAFVIKRGALEGSVNYMADWAQVEHPLLCAPLGNVWYDDQVSNFKRANQPIFIDGVMISTSKDYLGGTKNRRGNPLKDRDATDFFLTAPVFSDVYTGRMLKPDEAVELRKKYAKFDAKKPQRYFDLPKGRKAYDSVADMSGIRKSPMTGESEPRVFPKTYGCDGGYKYGDIVAMRSGTGAFYDTKIESGTVFVSGPRSGCTSSIIPANGLLNLPLFTEACVCSYPLPAGTALAARPQSDEQWAVWGGVPASALEGKLHRVGINFGAPGDRMTQDGTLWLDYPVIGGPSPVLQIEMKPAKPKYYYRNSLWMRGGRGWPWVAASGVKGVERICLRGLKNGDYIVRLTFAEPDQSVKAGGRVFDIKIQGAVVESAFDPVLRTGGFMRSMTLSSKRAVSVKDGELTISFTPRQGETILSGIEIVSTALSLEPELELPYVE